MYKWKYNTLVKILWTRKKIFPAPIFKKHYRKLGKNNHIYFEGDNFETEGD